MAVFIHLQYAKTVLGYNPISDQILVVRLKGKPVKVTFIQIFALSSDVDEYISKDFYDTLQNAVDTANKHYVILIMGEFNAKLRKRPDEDEAELLGPYGLCT